MARSVSPVGQRVTWHVQAAVPTAQVNADETVFVGEPMTEADWLAAEPAIAAADLREGLAHRIERAADEHRAEEPFDLTRRRGKVVCGVFVPDSARFPGKVW